MAQTALVALTIRIRPALLRRIKAEAKRRGQRPSPMVAYEVAKIFLNGATDGE